MELAGCRPEILHCGQRCQFTSTDFVAKLLAEWIRISGSGRKRWYDIILLRTLWRTVKGVVGCFSRRRAEVYLRIYSDGW
jgi:putative transposase